MPHEVDVWRTSPVPCLIPSCGRWRRLFAQQHTGYRLHHVGYENSEAVLGEVAVEGEGLGDLEALHDREADGIGHRELFVVVLEDDLSRPLLICRSDAYHCGRAPLHASQESLTLLDTKAGEDERVPFNQDDVGRKLRSLLPGE